MTKKKLATLVLVPKRWLRGAPWGSALRVKDGRMCCLGFECRRLRVPEEELINQDVPSRVLSNRRAKRFLERAPNKYLRANRDPQIERIIAGINDDETIPLTRAGDRQRVAKLRPLFRQLGVRLLLGKP